MALNSLTARANTGAGTDALAGITTAQGFAGAVALVDDTGALHNDANPVPVSAGSLPLPTGAATETTLALLAADLGDAADAEATGNGSAIAILKRIRTLLGGSGVLLAPPALLSSYNVAGVIAINTVLLTLDCSQYRSVSIQCVSMGTTGVVTPEWSNDNTTWVAATMQTAAGATATTFNAAGLWVLPVMARYLRLRLSTATTAGTTTLSVHQFDDRTQMWLATQPVSFTQPALVAGTAAIGDVGVQYRANNTGAASLANLNCPATPAAQAIKASAGRLLSITATNTNAAARWIKIWNTASGSVILGTTAALTEIAIPPNQTINVSLEGGIGFATAITMAVTGGQGLTNNSAVTVGDVTGIVAFA